MSLLALRQMTANKKVFTFLTAIFCASFVFFFINEPHAFAAMISGSDNPGNIAEATGGETSFRAIARKIVDFFLFFLGLVSTIMIIYGGFLYITARGEEEQAKKGQKILQYAVIGILIILISFALVSTILGAGSGTEPGAGGGA